MAITLIKRESINSIDDPVLHTTLYGDIKKTNTINHDEYTYFDSFEDYDLFVNVNGDTLAKKVENLQENSLNYIEKDIENIQNKYDIETVKYDDTTPAIIIKVSENNTNTLNQISNDYKDNKNYNIKLITPQVLFLELTQNEIQLEDNTALDKLSDQDMKNVIQKTGIKLNGTENKERLKGIMQGVLASTGNK